MIPSHFNTRRAILREDSVKNNADLSKMPTTKAIK